MPPRDAAATQLGYVVLLFALFVLPKLLERWRLPSAITSLGLGALASIGFGVFRHDQTVALLSTFGIVTLFLFAGLDVEGRELRKGARVIIQHLAVRGVLLVLVAVAAARFLGLEGRAAALLSLALLTPSTGFILHSLASFGLTPEERFWVKSKAIANEILALATLFVTLQSTTVERLAVSGIAMVAIIAVLPLLFRAFAAWIVPHAPRSEFAFLVMLAVLCAYATRVLGAYYLVGAFIVGVAANRFRERLPAIASKQLLNAVELFASFFIPFYFFHAGVELSAEDFAPAALATGAVFSIVAVSLCYGSVLLHRRLALGERPEQGRRVALALLPTLVFTLVLAAILRDEFAIAPHIVGGLVIYAVVSTMIPGLLLRTAALRFDAPTVDDEPSVDATA